MADAGATIVKTNFTRTINASRDDDRLTLGADLITNLPGYFAGLTKNPFGLSTLADLREKTRNTPAEENQIWGTGLWDIALDEVGFNNTDPRFWPAWQRLLQLQGPDGLLGALEKDNLTAIVTPHLFAAGMANFIGAPVVTVPLGYYPGNTEVKTRPGKISPPLVVSGPSVPFAISFVGRQWSDADLIGLAYSFEQKTQARSRARRIIMPEAEVPLSGSCAA
ncbi:hypothetical protein XA68_11560 [Ophiocordyceps unilateralis]|uniref:Amidase domain-containing protein n=1 Tax=Ophiocordyceps unilateralis TaxID=268505 RepID=A0A2A9PGK4_OPHUN|nr:hypothetical protein XA68_11560 [Ophiocordyceps unilateralis]